MLDQVRPESARVADELDHLGRKLRHVAETFEQEDNTAARNLEGMGWVDFETKPPGVGLVIGGIGGIGAIVIGGGFWWWNKNLEGISDNQAFDKIEGILEKTDRGRNALKTAEDLDVKFKLSKTGQGTWYDPKTNTMYIDPNTNPDLAAKGFVHELTHAKQHAENRFPDPSRTNRDEFVERAIECEAEATIAEFEYEKERWLLDYVMSSPEEEAYWEAYNDKLKALEQSQPEMSEAERHQLAYECGKDRVVDFYRDGSIVTSTTRQSYGDYYNEAWQKANPGWTDGTIPPNLA
jgi:hypothetical protein